MTYWKVHYIATWGHSNSEFFDNLEVAQRRYQFLKTCIWYLKVSEPEPATAFDIICETGK